jgi:arylsulfatase A-like enzyme
MTARKTMRLILIVLLPAILTVRSFCAPSAGPPAKPNVLFIVADDLGWADVGWHGSKFKTPRLDQLVREGVELDRHYVQPVCTPTRTALLSGRWTSRFGPHVLAPSNLRAFPPDTTTLASALKQCGYTTFLAGKWHLGSRLEWGPQNYGFDHSYGSLAGAVDPWEHTYRKGEYMKTWHRDGEFVEEKGNATELIVKQAIEWIRAKREPWFIYVPFQAVHIPIDAPEEFKRLYADVSFDRNEAKAESFRRFGAFVSQMDAKVGQLIATLKETGQRSNTIAVFTSDNGGTPVLANPYAGNTPPLKVAVSSNLPLRGHKNQLYEGGVRVPAFVNWPGVLKPRKLTAPLHAVDWMPTLTRLAGWQPPAEVKWDGLDIWPLLTGAVEKPAARTVYIPHPSGAAVYQGDWKLIARRKEKVKAELFDLSKDPFETTDLAAREPDRVKALQAALTELRKDDLTSLPGDLAPPPGEE